MKKISLTIDGQKVTAPEGETVLRAALDNGVYIPNLCALPSNGEAPASCRLCFVEISGREEPVTACTEKVAAGMAVNSRGEKARKLARAAFELLMASHPVDCARCAGNRYCELQRIARHLNTSLQTKRLRRLLPEFDVDDSSPLFRYDRNKCVLCGRCLWACRQHRGTSVLGFAHRGFGRVVTTFNEEPIGNTTCRECGECVLACPTGAMSFKDGTRESGPGARTAHRSLF